ncbi:uncharacterized protein LOC141592866 isoform X2 [Silene latifolia]|uniref:uncharacterized protein LOC141592866 isoform X2 n=1 Tax=Silene latifolia TaxID=37657 RepID=UPI003D77DF40
MQYKHRQNKTKPRILNPKFNHHLPPPCCRRRDTTSPPSSSLHPAVHLRPTVCCCLGNCLTAYQQSPPKSSRRYEKHLTHTKNHSMTTLVLLADLKVCEVTGGKPHDPSVFPVNFKLKNFQRGMNSPSNPPRVRDGEYWSDYNPHEKIKLEKAQYGLRFWLFLDDFTIREVIRKLNSYIALNPQPRRLEVIIIQIIMVQDEYFRDDEVMSWLRELEHERVIKPWKTYRVEDMDFKDDEEYCCSICLENMAEQKEKVLPVTRMSWSHMLSVFMEYFTKRKKDAFKEFMKREATMVSKMRCNHIFHTRCLMKWIKSSPSCPVCRFDLDKQGGFYRDFLEI